VQQSFVLTPLVASPARAQLADKARLEALLQAHGVTHGSHEWREMQPLSKDVDAFLANGAKGKGKQKRRRDPWCVAAHRMVRGTSKTCVCSEQHVGFRRGGLPQEAAEAAPITCIDDALSACRPCGVLRMQARRADASATAHFSHLQLQWRRR
jgi:hypothetical protein